VLPEDRFSGDWFDVFVGDCYRQPRILVRGETLSESDQPLILRIPTEYRDDFTRDIHEALREIGGISTLAVHPFFSNREAVAACLGRRRSIVSRTQVDFFRDELAALPDRFEDPDQPRWIHVDLALTGDAAGFACGYVPGFARISRGSTIETLPRIAIDCTLRVVPPSNGEISFERIRQLIYKLTELGLAIRWVSFDGFQSADSIQQLRMKGYQTGVVSVDRTTDAYDVLKTAIYDGRVLAPMDEHLMGELLALEMDHERGKVDHPSAPGASKDVADCLAAVVHGLSRRRETWARHGVPLSAIPIALLPRQSARRDATSQ